MKKWMQTVAACLAVLLLGGGVLVQQAHAVTSVVSLDVNPSIELRVNSRERWCPARPSTTRPPPCWRIWTEAGT